MPAKRKLDLAAARLLHEAGASFALIARRQGVSPQAVQKAASKAGWKRGEGDGAILAETATAKRILEPVTPADFRIAKEGVRTLENMRVILDCIASGGTRSVAAGLAGIGEETMRTWLKEDDDFAVLLRRAEAEKTWRRLQHLEARSAAGDTLATKVLLERDPASRAEWGPAPVQAIGDGPQLVVNLFLGAGAAAALADSGAPITITSTPQAAAPILEHDEGAVSHE